MKTTESGIHSISFRNALATAKRNASKEKYSFEETVLDVKYGYHLTEAESEALREKLIAYCKKNYLYICDMN
jgi:hypothetical protein